MDDGRREEGRRGKRERREEKVNKPFYQGRESTTGNSPDYPSRNSQRLVSRCKLHLHFFERRCRGIHRPHDRVRVSLTSSSPSPVFRVILVYYSMTVNSHQLPIPLKNCLLYLGRYSRTTSVNIFIVFAIYRPATSTIEVKIPCRFLLEYTIL